MIKLTLAAFLRRQSGGFQHLKREFQRNYIKQGGYNIGSRDELLNQIEGMEIDSVFERITGVTMEPGAKFIRGRRRPPVMNRKTQAPVSDEPAQSHDFKYIEDEFESLGNFSSLKDNGDFQDLTHEERQGIQHFEAQARLRDSNGTLNKDRAKVEPKHDAKKIIKKLGDCFQDNVGTEESDPREASLVDENRFDELVSRIRSKIREEKKETSKVNNAKIPNFNGIIVDPIARHVERRRLRINAMIKEHLEQIITSNDPSLIFGNIKGISIALKSVEMSSSKSSIRCYYTIMGTSLDELTVQKLLEKSQGKVRFCLARKLELGYTPPVVFIKAIDVDKDTAKLSSSSPTLAFNNPMETTMQTLKKQFHKKMVAF